MNIVKLEKGKFYSIYRDCASDSFLFGQLITSCGDGIVFHSINTDGSDDGFIMIKSDAVCMIEYETQYSQKMVKLMKSKGTVLIHEEILSINSFEKFFSYISQQKELTDIKLYDRDVSIRGYIEEFNAEVCVMKQYDDYGNPDGFCMFDIENIEVVGIRTRELKELKLFI